MVFLISILSSFQTDSWTITHKRSLKWTFIKHIYGGRYDGWTKEHTAGCSLRFYFKHNLSIDYLRYKLFEKLKQVSDQLDVYSFKDITAIEKDSDIKINKEKSLLIIADYEKTVKKYSKLKAEKTI